MTVGFENVGKTSLLDCLFPIKGTFFQIEQSLVGLERWKAYYFVLQGQYLLKFRDRDHFRSKENPLLAVSVENRHWKVERVEEKGFEGYFGLSLSSIQDSQRRGKERRITLFTESEKEREMMLNRLKRICMNEATSGITIQQPETDHPFVLKQLKPEEKLELSIWDFAGQHHYYNSHHYFLSSRSVFLILYRLDQGDQGLKGLGFWLKSLSAHLDPALCNQEYSIIIVGTFLDQRGVVKEHKPRRAKSAQEIATANGMDVGIHYHEVSCLTLEHIEDVEECIYFSVLKHSYMGQRVPRTYKLVEETVRQLGRENSTCPVISTDQVLNRCRIELPVEMQTVRRALYLLSLWGECIYFPDHSGLENVVVADPRFLTTQILASLFSPANETFYYTGRVKHERLKLIWSMFPKRSEEEFWNLTKTLLILMEKFEVCFPIASENPYASFQERESLIPGYLPYKREKSEKERQIWPDDPPHNRSIEIERSILFNVLPIELVSRLLVRIHDLIQDSMVWRNEVYLLDLQTNTQAYIRTSINEESFYVTLRGQSREACDALMKVIIGHVS